MEKKISKGVIALALVLMIILTGVLGNRVLNNRREMRGLPSTDHLETIDYLIEQEDYVSLFYYCNQYHIYGFDEEFENYYLIIMANREYGYAFEELSNILFDENITSNDITYFCTDIERFLDCKENAEYYNYDEQYNNQVYQAMKDEIDSWLIAYFHLDSKLDEFYAASEIQKAVMIEEAYYECIEK